MPITVLVLPDFIDYLDFIISEKGLPQKFHVLRVLILLPS
jgi:hypothetical protein